jgi:glycosyltransferase involved in cell wall biosynthesis
MVTLNDLQTDQIEQGIGELSTRARSICLVAGELAYLFKNGGIGTCNWRMAAALARSGWKVHILYCRAVEDAKLLEAVSRDLAEIGCTISVLDQFSFPYWLKSASSHGGITELPASEQVRSALEQLHTTYHFDLIEFAEYGGLGFRTVEAKRAGRGFQDTGLIVKLHSPNVWVRWANRRRACVGHLAIDYCERYSFENADFRITQTRYMEEYLRRNGWGAGAEVWNLPYGIPEVEDVQIDSPVEAPRELVFFGRLETRKGLELFLEAVPKLPPSLSVTFLGKEGPVSHDTSAVNLIQRRLRGHQFTILTGMDQEQATNYLKTGGKLAVIPSLSENLPNTLIECALHGVPVIAAAVGGIPEIVRAPRLASDLLFQPRVDDLTRCVRQHLAMTPDERLAVLRELRSSVKEAWSNERFLQAYEELAMRVRSTRRAPAMSWHKEHGDVENRSASTARNRMSRGIQYLAYMYQVVRMQFFRSLGA